jgi:pimeloyl-ACP methyl ester carboxylesterase
MVVCARGEWRDRCGWYNRNSAEWESVSESVLSRYFADLRARPINAGHFFIEEAPEATNRFLLDFLKGRI